MKKDKISLGVMPVYLKHTHYHIFKRTVSERLLEYPKHLPELTKSQREIINTFFANENGLLLICGASGTGKSCLAAGLISTYLLEQLAEAKRTNTRIENDSIVCYILAYNYFVNMRNHGNANSDTTKYEDVKLLVIDEFGASKFSEYEIQTILFTLTSRENKLKKTILVTNHNVVKLSEILPEPLIRRFNENYVIEI